MKKKISKPKKANGYILMDVIAAIAISTVLMGSVLAGYSLLLKAAGLTRDRVQVIITERNELEKTLSEPYIQEK